MSRKEIFEKSFKFRGVGLEIGPLSRPVLTKAEANVYYVDHLPLKELKKKYDGSPIVLDEIVDVDYVLKDTLHKTVGNKKFDYVIASHVIEHVSDTVRWLQDIASILNPGGKLALVIPDKRFTFDITRNVSRPADVIGAYVDNLGRASSANMYDFVVECREKIIPGEVWQQPYKDYGKKPHLYTDPIAYEKSLDNAKGKYVDSHCFVFTPYSFFEIIRKLIDFGLFDFEVVGFTDTPRNEIEFYVTLKKVKPTKARQLRSLPKLKKPKAEWQLASRVNELETEVKQLRQEVHGMINSKSWKLTKPVRLINSIFK